MIYYQLNSRLCHDYNSKSYRMTFGSCGTFLFDIIQSKKRKQTELVSIPRCLDAKNIKGTVESTNYFLDKYFLYLYSSKKYKRMPLRKIHPPQSEPNRG